MYRRIGLVLMIAVLITFTGCTDLSKFDLPGQVELERKDDGLPFRQIYIHNYPLDHPSPSLNLFAIVLDFIKVSDIFSDLEFTKQFSVAHNHYFAVVKFKEIPPGLPCDFIKIRNSQGKEVPITILSQNIQGGDDKYFFYRLPGKGPNFSGDCLLSFVDEASKTEWLLRSNYTIDCEGGSRTSDRTIRASITITVGTRYYLEGVRDLGPDGTVTIQVLDWNLDGSFNDADMVQIVHSGKIERFALNKKVHGGSKEYGMDLKRENTDEDRYGLTIYTIK
ncbi:MAG TPA: hypothetical protein DDW50_15760 [Firmicutes bacterium]|jgi:hypothetical protein|nr:hypothetical protein [Bacillota bacterium]